MQRLLLHHLLRERAESRSRASAVLERACRKLRGSLLVVLDSDPTLFGEGLGGGDVVHLRGCRDGGCLGRSVRVAAGGKK